MLNSVGYLIVFIIFSWEIIYYAIKSDNYNPQNYFILKRHDKCMVHQSTTCPCTLNLSEKEFYIAIRHSIDFYKISSSFFEIVDKKIVYITTNSKIKLLNYDYENLYK